MRFYDMDSALLNAVGGGETDLRVQIGIAAPGGPVVVPEKDILEADFYSLKETSGGITARGDVFLENPGGAYSGLGAGPGTEVTVSFTVGEGLPCIRRFALYLDDKGIQDIRGPGRKRVARLGLRDFSGALRKTDEAKDWTAPAVFAYSVVCDPARPEKSLLHGIALRAGISANAIDCAAIPVTLPYVRLRRNVWAELSALAKAYRCHLECSPDKRLVFGHSPYQREPLEDDAVSHTFTGEDIFYLRTTDRADQYRNTVRLKVNMPVSLEQQEIWRYEDPPVLYDVFVQGHYPFRFPLVREIEAGNYEAVYRVVENGKERPVVYADLIDNKEEAENRLDYDGGPFSYSRYDVASHHDRALLTLHKDADGDLYNAPIHGRPIVLDLNRSCFLRDSLEVQRHGTFALNVTGSYFSDYPINGKPHYEDWVSRELAERLAGGREFVVKTHRALVNARVGARVQIAMSRGQLAKGRSTEGKEYATGIIDALHFRYRRNEAFRAGFKIKEVRT